MEYRGNHYFFNIKNECFALGRSLIELCTCYIKYFPFQVKCTGFPGILSKWVRYFDLHFIRSKIWCSMIENSYGGQNRKYRFAHFHIYL